MSQRPQRRFSGFPEGRVTMVTLPDCMFTDMLPCIDDIDELRITLLTLRRLAQLRSDTAAWVTLEELGSDPAVQAVLAGDDCTGRLQRAVELALEHGILLQVMWTRADGAVEQRILANSIKGRAAVAAMQRGLLPRREETGSERPNIFTLYEHNIGPLTALMTEELMEAEATYPAAWIEDAFREAVYRNARNWKYIRAILERWQTEGRDEIDRRNR